MRKGRLNWKLIAILVVLLGLAIVGVFFFSIPHVPSWGIASVSIDRQTYFLEDNFSVSVNLQNEKEKPLVGELIVLLESPKGEEELGRSSITVPSKESLVKTFRGIIAFTDPAGSYMVVAKLISEENFTKSTTFSVRPPVEIVYSKVEEPLYLGESLNVTVTLKNNALRTVDNRLLLLSGYLEDGKGNLIPRIHKEIISIGSEIEKDFKFGHEIYGLGTVGSYVYSVNLSYGTAPWDEYDLTVKIEYPLSFLDVDLRKERLNIGEVQNLTFSFENNLEKSYKEAVLKVELLVGTSVEKILEKTVNIVPRSESFEQEIYMNFNTTGMLEGKYHIYFTLRTDKVFLCKEEDVENFDLLE